MEHTLRERRLTTPVSLTDANGHLNWDAAGWASQPLVDTSGVERGRGRNKRWEYWGIVSPTHLIGLTVSHIDYAAVHEVWVMERASERTWGTGATVIPARGVELPAVLEAGCSRAHARKLDIAIDEVAGGTRLRGVAAGVRLDILAELPPGHERLAVVVPWSERRFQYTVKDVARPARGWVETGGVRQEVQAEESWAVLDHGRGRWPYDVHWNWGAGSGRNAESVIGLQVGGTWTAGSGVSENAVVVDGRLHKIHGELSWEYDISRWRTPWRVSGGGLDAMFTPFYNKRSRTNLGILASRTDQCFGYWSGRFHSDGSRTVEFADLLGWAEDVHNRW